MPLRRELALASFAKSRREFSPAAAGERIRNGRTDPIAVKAVSYVSALAMHSHQKQVVAVHELLSTVIYENGFRPTGEPPFSQHL